MYLLAAEAERERLEELTKELRKVFPTAQIHAEEKAPAALQWADTLAAGALEYAFLDIHMGGLELAGELKRRHPGVKLIFCASDIAHRLSTIMHCDRIFVMDAGQIVEEGNFEQLMEKKGLFYHLASRQMV